MRLQKDAATRVLDVLLNWRRMRPHKRFYGLTLEEFESRAKPFLDARDEVAHLQAEVTRALSTRDAAAIPLLDLVECVVNAVKGDPEEGHNGALYAAMGFVPKNQRSTGLVRRRNKDEPPAPKEVSS